MLGLDQIGQTLGECKIVDAVIAHRQLLHTLQRQRFGDARRDIENQKLDLQLVADESNAHLRHLLPHLI